MNANLQEKFESGLDELRNYFTRHFFRRIKIYKSDDFLFEKPEIKSLRKYVETFPLRPKIEIKSSRLLEFHGKLECVTGGFRFSQELAKVHGDKIRRYVKQEIKIHKFNGMKKLRTWDATKRIIAIPQERTNRLKWQRERPKLNPGEMLLAWYGPIVDGAVLKLALNKQKGTLLIWYNHRSRQFKARGVFLFRRLGLGEKPQWRWV